MEFIIILVVLTLIYIFLKIVFSVKIKKLKQFEKDEYLDKVVSKYPENTQICEEILKKVNNNLRDLQDIPLHEFKEIQGIGKVKAIQLKAICELTKRISRPINDAKIQIKNTDDIAKILIEELKYEKREIVKLVLLNTKNIILKIIDISFGGTSSAFVEPKDILLEAIKIGAPKIIIAHNHPSGDPTPSLADFEITNRIEKAGQIMGIELLDHIVIGDCNYISIFSKRGVNNV